VTGERPLSGRSVLLPRPKEKRDDLVCRLEALGARVSVRPTIAFEPPSDPEPARRAIREIERYDLLVFTSARGVACFLDLARTEGVDPGRRRRTVAAVGPATASALREAGITVDLVATDSRAEGLAAALSGLEVRGRQILLVRPEVARDVLPEALRERGARVDAVPFYRTVPAASASQTALELERGSYDAVVFTAPSTLRALLAGAPAGREAVLRGLARVARVAIGPVTAEALAEAGVPAHAVADSPAAESIAEALVRVLRGRPGVC